MCVKKSVDVVCDSNHYAEVFFDGEMVKAYCLSSASDLEAMREGLATNATWPTSNSQRAFVLVNDIDLGTQQTWEPLPFPEQGSLVGNAHNIWGDLTCDGDCALFDTFEKAKVHDLNLNFKITAEGNAASLAMNVNYTKIKNVQVNGEISTSQNAGGIVYISERSSISYSNFKGSIFGGETSSVGGIVYELLDGSILSQCVVDGVLNAKNVGGIAAMSESRIINTHSFGEFRGMTIGGIVSFGDELAKIILCSSAANIYGSEVDDSNVYFGGLFGHCDDGVIDSSVFYGSIYGKNNVGGLIGVTSTDPCVIKRSGVFGIIEGNGQTEDIGGIFGQGFADDGQNQRLYSSFVAADIRHAARGAQIGRSNFYLTEGYSTGGFEDVGATSVDAIEYSNNANEDYRFYYWYDSGTDNILAKSIDKIDYVGMDQKVGDTLLVDALNKAYQEANSSTESPWELRVCEITTGPAKGTPTKYNMAVPKSMVDISICKPYTP